MIGIIDMTDGTELLRYIFTGMNVRGGPQTAAAGAVGDPRPAELFDFVFETLVYPNGRALVVLPDGQLVMTP